MKKEQVKTVNNVSIILLTEKEERLVPIKPICEALGVSFQGQNEKIKDDPILSSVVKLSLSTGADGKEYEMFCIPLEFAFGWLFTINPKNVSPEAKEAVTKYKLECYKALFEYFTEPQTFLKEKQQLMNERVEEYQQLQSDFKNARSKMNESKEELNKVMKYTIEDWRANKDLLFLPFEEHEATEEVDEEE